MPGAAPALLQVRALSKSFGGVVANDALSFDVPEGAIIGVIGPNGSGKTTLFNCLTAQVRPDSGMLSFAGRDLRKLDTAGIARLGLVRTFQQAHVYGGLTCLQNLEISAAQAGETLGAMLGRPGVAAARKAQELLHFVGLEGRDAAAAGKLSYGERKLLELAMALMSEPKMLLLDEPTAGVNPVLVQSMVERLQLVNRTRGITLLVIEHNMRAVMELAQRIHCLARGRLLASGTPDEIRADPRVLEAYLGTA